MGTSINTSVFPEIPFSRRVIKDIETHQRMLFPDTVKGNNRGTNTSPIPGPTNQQDAKTFLTKTLSDEEIPEQMQEDTLQLESVETVDTSSTDTDTVVNQDSKPTEVGRG